MEKKQIKEEATKKIGEITTLAMSRDPAANYSLFGKWVAKRTPKQQLFSLISNFGTSGATKTTYAILQNERKEKKRKKWNRNRRIVSRDPTKKYESEDKEYTKTTFFSH